MKVIVFYTYLIFLLLCGGNHLYTDMHLSQDNISFNQNREKNVQIKHENSRHCNVLKQSADIEVDEEFHTSDDYNDKGTNKLLDGRQYLSASWYLRFFQEILFKDYSNNFKILALFSVHSNPIYLRIGVFRI